MVGLFGRRRYLARRHHSVPRTDGLAASVSPFVRIGRWGTPACVALLRVLKNARRGVLDRLLDATPTVTAGA